MSRIQSSDEKQQLRLKIKKLKYKLEKEEKIQQQFQNSLNRLRRFEEEKLTFARVLKKVSFLLQIKGLTMEDWLRAYPYDEELEVERLVKVLDRLGVRLPRDQKGLIVNFLEDQFAEEFAMDDFRKFIVDTGLEME